MGKDCGRDKVEGVVVGGVRCDSRFEGMRGVYDERVDRVVYVYVIIKR